jgi:hypothetical protein
MRAVYRQVGSIRNLGRWSGRGLPSTIARMFALAAASPIHVVVTPARPTPAQAVTVEFTAPSTVSDGSRWYAVSISAPEPSSRCENNEETDTTVARRGRRVRLVLRPVDKGRWCDGEYTGEIDLERRIRCDDRIDDGSCYEPRRIAGFSFEVAE